MLINLVSHYKWFKGKIKEPHGHNQIKTTEMYFKIDVKQDNIKGNDNCIPLDKLTSFSIDQNYLHYY